MLKTVTIFAGLVLATGFAAPASAASFDCGRASTSDERAICADPELSALDSEMGALWFTWSRAPMAMGGLAVRREEARDFLIRRHACGSSSACIGRAYRDRNAELRRQIDGTMAQYRDIVGL